MHSLQKVDVSKSRLQFDSFKRPPPVSATANSSHFGAVAYGRFDCIYFWSSLMLSSHCKKKNKNKTKHKKSISNLLIKSIDQW